MSLCLYDFSFNLSLSYAAALLICMENTFWNVSTISTKFTFVDLFKNSFTLYVESGKRKEVEVAIDILKKEQGRFRGLPQLIKDSVGTRKKVKAAMYWILGKEQFTKDSAEKFVKIIMGHYLRKFHWFYLHLTVTHLRSNV